MNQKISLSKHRLLGILLLLSTIGSLVFTYGLYNFNMDSINANNTSIITHIRQESIRVAARLEQRFKDVMPLVNAIAKQASVEKLSPTELETVLAKKIVTNIQLLDLGVVYVPYVTSPDIRLHSAIYQRNETGKITKNKVPYDYTQLKYKWYQTLLVRGPYWSDPYYHEGYKQTVIRQGTPFYRYSGKSKKLMGIIVATISLDDIKDILSTTNINDAGYAFLTSANGYFIAHPNEDLITNEKTIFNIIGETSDVVLPKIQRVLEGQQTTIDLINIESEKSSWIDFTPIKSTQWTLGIRLYKNEVQSFNNPLRHQLIWLSLSLMLAGILISATLIVNRFNQIKGYVVLSIILACLTIAEISYIWNLRLTIPDLTDEQGLVVINKALMEKHISHYFAPFSSKERQQLVMIPTGIKLETIQYVSGTTIKLTGYIWQKFPLDKIELSEEFHIPNAITPPHFSLVYEKKEEDYIKKGWFFSTTIQSDFNSVTYPLDKNTITLQLQPSKLDGRVVLVPDLESYERLNPSTLPGLSSELNIPQWNLLRSYFSYDKHISYDKDLDMMKNTPELHFVIVSQRKFSDAFISGILPLVGISWILFTLLLVTTHDSRKMSSFGYNKINIFLGPISGLIFAVILMQIRMRDSIETTQIVYLEYFYFLMYFALISTLMNVLMFNSSNNPIKLIAFKDNLIPKLTYWPVLLLSLLAITISFLY